MKYIKANKVRSKYKNTEAWLDAVYRKNKEYIDSTFISTTQSGKSIKVQFKQSVKDYIYGERKFTPEEALKATQRSSHFTTPKERIRANLMSRIKKEKEGEFYKKFRQIAFRESGKYAKYDPDKWFYHYDDKVYTYDGRIMISFSNSPQSVIMKVLDEKEKKIYENKKNKAMADYYEFMSKNM